MNEISSSIIEIKKQLGKRLLILGHHYQRPEVLQHADIIGDSLELSRQSASRPEAETIIFCGVRFMAETAAILCGDHQIVYISHIDAGCPLANMIDEKEMLSVWETLQSVSQNWVPVVYVNSSVQVKALCGKLDGYVCTSRNAARVIKYLLDNSKKIFFLPDRHLAENTSLDMGLPPSEFAVYNPKLPSGGLSKTDIQKARIVAWSGYCIVHTAFKLEHVEYIRKTMPDAKIVVHPEVPAEVARMCDVRGSTSQIIEYVKNAPTNSTIVIGTELRLVERLANEYKGYLTIKALHQSICANMSKTTEADLLEVLVKRPEQNKIIVPADIAENARKPLARMVSIV